MKSTITKVDNSFPASKGDVQAMIQASNSNLEAEFNEYRDETTSSDSILEAKFNEYNNKTTTVINNLVGKVNALTPVGCSLESRAI